MSKVIYHLTTEHIFYLDSQQCYLTLKADGYYKSELLSKIDKECEYEDINGKKFIFNVLNDDNNIQDKVFNLAQDLNIIYPIEFSDEINIDNFESLINTYIDFFDSLDLDIIPKFYLKIKKENFIEILGKLINFFPNTSYPNDGWVIVPENERYIAKLKPSNHLTIDLKYKNNKFFDNKWKEVIVEKGDSYLKNNSIYRCYWIDNKWKSKEERIDKKHGNGSYIIEIITNYLSKGYNLEDFKSNNFKSDYYEHVNKNESQFLEYFIFMKEFTKKWLSENITKEASNNLLDVGCGKSSHIFLKEIGINNIVGIDSDPICILKSTVDTRTNKYIWLDINKDWTIREQINRFGQLWENSQLYKIGNLFNKFNIILFNFSIFYCERDNYKMLINNLNKVSNIGTKLFFNFINYESASNSIIDKFSIKSEGGKIMLKLPWMTKVHIEPLFDYQDFSNLLLDNNWKLIKKSNINEKLDLYEDWQDLMCYEIWEKC